MHTDTPTAINIPSGENKMHEISSKSSNCLVNNSSPEDAFHILTVLSEVDDAICCPSGAKAKSRKRISGGKWRVLTCIISVPESASHTWILPVDPDKASFPSSEKASARSKLWL